MIYHYTDPFNAYPKQKAMVIPHHNEGPVGPTKIGEIMSLSIFRSCKQLHAECCPVVYSENIFQVWALTKTDLSASYRQLVRHAMFTTESDYRIYSKHFDEVSHGWKRRFWPSIVAGGTELLARFPGIETLTAILTPPRSGPSWRPVFFANRSNSKERRIEIAAQWLQGRCPIEDDRLRACLRLELKPPPAVLKEDTAGSRFADDDDEDEWDYTEFADAFRLMSSLG